MKFKKVFLYDNYSKTFRLFRLLRKRIDKNNKFLYSEKLSLALKPILFSYYKPFSNNDELWVGFLGFYFHYQRSYGGVHI